MNFAQTKVSIVMPCYNKAPYIGETLRSVCNQNWDNIEFILVDDGSTDETRDIIVKWIPKLENRGYEVILLNQENAGVAAAIRAGLRRISGEYVCFPDADDELHPEYISTMAAHLDNNADCDMVACGFGYKTGQKSKVSRMTFNDSYHGGQLLEKVLLQRLPNTVCIYLVRVKYLHNCGLPENMAVSPPVSQEPPLLVPLLFNVRECGVTDKILYIYNTYSRDLGNSHISDPVKRILHDYFELACNAISLLPACESEKKRLCAIASLGCAILCNAIMLPEQSDAYEKLLACASSFADRYFHLAPKVGIDDIRKGSFAAFGCAASARVLGSRPPESIKPFYGGKRIIAWGVLGQQAKQLLPALSGTPLCPQLFWDAAASDKIIFPGGVSVTKPDADVVTENDVLLCMPKSSELFDSLTKDFGHKAAAVLSNNDIVEYLADFHFPQFGNCVFSAGQADKT